MNISFAQQVLDIRISHQSPPPSLHVSADVSTLVGCISNLLPTNQEYCVKRSNPISDRSSSCAGISRSDCQLLYVHRCLLCLSGKTQPPDALFRPPYLSVSLRTNKWHIFGYCLTSHQPLGPSICRRSLPFCRASNKN